MDRVRTREFVQRLEQGEDEIDAFWAVASDPGIGFSRFRGKTKRPDEIVLRRKLAALLERAAPAVIAAAQDLALARLSGLSDDAVRAVAEVVTGETSDSRSARARLDAAKLILASIGIGDRPGMTVATQVNVSPHSGGVPDGA